MRYSLIVVLVFAAGCSKHFVASKASYDQSAMGVAGGVAKADERVRAFAAPAPIAYREAADSGSTHMVIRTGQASIEVDSVDRAVAKVRDLARAVGGYVGSSTIERGDDNVRTATLAMDVPEERFDGVLGSLAPIGRVESVSVTARDVGEEYVDFEAREANARRLEERLVALLATRTGKLKDVLDVERELARVRGEIEQSEGRLRYLKAHSAMSTLEVTVHEHSAVLAESPGEHPIREAVHQAWRNFVGLVSLAIASVGVLLPLSALAVGAWLIVQRLRRRRPSNATT